MIAKMPALRCLAAVILLMSNACSGTEAEAEGDRILVLTFPTTPNPPTQDLIRGMGSLQSIKKDDTEATILSEALLECGVKRFLWRELAYHGSTLVLADNKQNRAAVKCAAKSIPWDFYMRSEVGSENG